MMTSTGISETNKEILESKYGTSWSITPENRAFLGARQQCEQPTHPRYSYAGARGIQFLYDDIDDLLADIGFRPGENFALERIEMTKNFEPGNVRWSPRSVISQKQRPQVKRNLETMMLAIIRTLKRQPNMEMPRSELQHHSGSSVWGAAIFHETVQQLITLGFVTYTIETRTQIEPDGHHPGLTRRVTRRIPIVRLKQGVKRGTTNNESV